jgi:hypothetical protein
MPVTFSETPVSVSVDGRSYNGTYREEDGRLHVSSAYGSKHVSALGRKKGLKEAARLVLKVIVTKHAGTRREHSQKRTRGACEDPATPSRVDAGQASGAPHSPPERSQR